jgi:hypothetical protein
VDQAERVPAAPGLTVVRQPAPGDFGPYLGGQKVRDAVSGLGRVLPLGYAGDAGRDPNATWPGCLAPRPRRGPGWPGPLAAVLDRDRPRWPRCAPS